MPRGPVCDQDVLLLGMSCACSLPLPKLKGRFGRYAGEQEPRYETRDGHSIPSSQGWLQIS